MDRYFYSVEDDGGKKVIHLSGNVYFNDVDETETCYRIAEWTWMYLSLQEVSSLMKDDVFYEYINEKVVYLGDITKEEAEEICSTYFDGQPGIKLDVKSVTEDTPCGDYWW